MQNISGVDKWFFGFR